MSGCSLKKRAFQSSVGLILYILIWSAVFMTIEQTGEPNIVVADRILKDVKNNVSRLLGDNFSDEHFFALVSKISEAVKIKETPDWTYWQSTDFVVQALTTIGFGAMTPRTLTGQMVFILFALIGLPLTMVTLKITGELLHDAVKKLIIFFERRFLQKKETKNLCFKSAIASFSGFICLLAVSAGIFGYVNQITYLEGIYASFVMLSTIGFGDYIFDFRGAQQKSHISNASMTALLVLNLPFFLMCLTIVSCFLNSVMFVMESLRGRKSCISDSNTQGEDNPVPCSTSDQEMHTKTSLQCF